MIHNHAWVRGSIHEVTIILVNFLVFKVICFDFDCLIFPVLLGLQNIVASTDNLKIKDTEVFLDAYNANPSSMLSAIEGFVESIGDNADYCLILGDMYELGRKSDEYHEDLAKTLSDKAYKNFYFIGKFASQYNKGCGGKGSEYSSAESFKKDFEKTVLKNHKYVFIKGSRSLQLESLVDIN